MTLQAPFAQGLRVEFFTLIDTLFCFYNDRNLQIERKGHEIIGWVPHGEPLSRTMPWGVGALDPEHGLCLSLVPLPPPDLGKGGHFAIGHILLCCGWRPWASTWISINKNRLASLFLGASWRTCLGSSVGAASPWVQPHLPLVGKSWNPSLLKLLASRVALSRFVCMLSIIL